MRNFEYLVPTRVVFGRDTQHRCGELCRRYGASKVLIHYGGGSVKRSGLFDQVAASLDDAGLPWIEFGGVVPNPRIGKIREGIVLARKEGVDFILALGGGSAIDSAKGIAVGLAHPDRDVWDFYSGASTPTSAAAVGVVLTLAASGSETSKSSVVSRDEDGSKRPLNDELIRPRFAVMNPELTATLPPYQSASGIVDIMSHVLERYMSAEPGGDVTGMMSEGLLRAVVKNAPVVMDRPGDYEARAQIMWAGSLAHSDILGVGRAPDWASHRIEHELTRYTDIAHGAGLAVVMPAMMKYVLTDESERLADLARRVWDVPDEVGDELEIAREGIDRMTAFFRSLGMPVRLSEAGIGEELVPKIARTTQRSAEGIVGGHRRLEPEDIEAVLHLAR